MTLSVDTGVQACDIVRDVSTLWSLIKPYLGYTYDTFGGSSPAPVHSSSCEPLSAEAFSPNVFSFASLRNTMTTMCYACFSEYDEVVSSLVVFRVRVEETKSREEMRREAEGNGDGQEAVGLCSNAVGALEIGSLFQAIRDDEESVGAYELLRDEGERRAFRMANWPVRCERPRCSGDT